MKRYKSLINRSSCALPLVLLLAILFLSLLAFSPGPAAAGTTEDVSNVTTYRASDITFNDSSEIAAAIENNTVEPAGKMVVGETLIVVIDSERLTGTMSSGNGTNTERFLSALKGDANLRLVQTNPTTEKPEMIVSVGQKNTTAHRIGTTVYALIDTGNLTFRLWKIDQFVSADIHGGERFAVEFANNFTERTHSRYDPAAPVVEFYPYESRFYARLGDWYKPLPPEWIQGDVQVNIEPEESLIARIRLDTGQTISTVVDVTAETSFPDFWFDLRDVQPGTGYALELVFDGEVIDSYHGDIREPEARVWNAELTRIDNQTAVNVTAELSHGGGIAVVNEDCERVAWEWVEPGVETRLSHKLWNPDGTEIRKGPDSGYGVSILAYRDMGSSKTVYDGPDARTNIDFNATCQPPSPPWSSISTPSPTSEDETVTESPPPPTSPEPDLSTTDKSTLPHQSDETPTGDNGVGDEQTASPGQPGFTFLTMLTALFVVALVRRHFV